jgi:hypothetical protein
MPAYREEEHIAYALVNLITGLRGAGFQFEVIVVLDSVQGDQTGPIVHQLCERFNEIRLIERKGRRGVGDAIGTGIRLAQGDIVVPMMGDYSESSWELLKLVNAITEGYDVAIGERFKHGKPAGYPVLKYVSNRFFNNLARLMFRIPSSDATNAFKAYRTQLLKDETFLSKGFEIFIEMPVKVLRNSALKIIKLPVEHTVRKKREAKLSLIKDGPRYLRLVFSLFSSGYFHKVGWSEERVD